MSCEYYRVLFSQLRQATDTERWPPDSFGRAPYKPLLLLAVLDAVAQGQFADGKVRLTESLVDTFREYWFQVMPPGIEPNLAMPFFHLRNDGGFWTLAATPGNERAVSTLKAIRSVPELHALVQYARLDGELMACLGDPAELEALRSVLLDTYFTSDAAARLRVQGIVEMSAHARTQRLLTDRKVAEPAVASQYELAVAASAFRSAVLTLYLRRCTFCGVRLVMPDGRTAVDAVHIRIATRQSDDRPANGLSLCGLCRWAFTAGMVGADEQRSIVLSPLITAGDNLPGQFSALAGRPLLAPTEPLHAPDPAALAWHREHVFRAA